MKITIKNNGEREVFTFGNEATFNSVKQQILDVLSEVSTQAVAFTNNNISYLLPAAYLKNSYIEVHAPNNGSPAPSSGTL